MNEIAYICCGNGPDKGISKILSLPVKKTIDNIKALKNEHSLRKGSTYWNGWSIFSQVGGAISGFVVSAIELGPGIAEVGLLDDIVTQIMKGVTGYVIVPFCIAAASSLVLSAANLSAEKLLKCCDVDLSGAEAEKKPLLPL